MSDGVLQVTPGTGAWVPIDSITFGGQTASFQFTKLMDGTAGSTNRAVVSAGGALKVDPSGVTQPVTTAQGSVVSGQTKVGATGTQVNLAAHALVVGVKIKALIGNAAAITIGPTGVNNTVDGTGNGMILYPGDDIFIPVTNTNELFINGTSGDGISFLGN